MKKLTISNLCKIRLAIVVVVATAACHLPLWVMWANLSRSSFGIGGELFIPFFPLFLLIPIQDRIDELKKAKSIK